MPADPTRPDAAPAVTGAPALILRAEGAALALAAGAAWSWTGQGWGLFALGFLVPDLAMLVYLAGPRAGAVAYNLAHSTVPALASLAAGLAGALPGATAAGLIWLAHVGFDRAMGYGLKYPTGFGDTHLGRVGGRRMPA